MEEDNETLIADMTDVGQRVLLAKGGNGGFGNAYFTTSTNRAPRRANPGLEGEERTLWLRLKLIADAGLVGLPNAGKSTFLATVTAAKPKIADYPFTTLHPGLGVVRVDGREFVLADIPGLIEGAHEGVGLGDRFLGHVERCRVLLHLVEGTRRMRAKPTRRCATRLEAYGHGLAEKPEIVALSKADALDEDTLKEQLQEARRRPASATPFVISSASGQGVQEVLQALLAVIDQAQGRGRAGPAAGRVASVSPQLRQFRRIVLKVGSALLVDRARGRLNHAWLAALAEDIADLHAKGADVLVVSSGAIAMGRTVLGLPSGPLRLEESQAAAAVGQIALAAHLVGGARPITASRPGQILVTLADTEQRRRYLNARATTLKLLEMRAVPVINENDTVATSEIRYGDNDRLAARVATMIGADLLVLLSDIDGLYTAPPASDPEAEHIPVVERITPAIEAMAGGAASELSRGGMRTKLEAGKIATAGGTP